MSVGYGTQEPAVKLPRAGFFWALGILVIGVGVAVAWFVTGLFSTLSAVEDFPRAEVPQTLEVEVTEPGTYRIFLENEAQQGSDIAVQVSTRTGPPSTFLVALILLIVTLVRRSAAKSRLRAAGPYAPPPPTFPSGPPAG